MSKDKQMIQIKCVVKCLKCGEEQGVLSAFCHDRETFPNLSYKEFYEMADNNYDKFEKLIIENLSVVCDKCNSESKILEILDMQYI